jgi:hypothetical protein
MPPIWPTRLNQSTSGVTRMHHRITSSDRAILTPLKPGPTYASLHRTRLRDYLDKVLEVE